LNHVEINGLVCWGNFTGKPHIKNGKIDGSRLRFSLKQSIDWNMTGTMKFDDFPETVGNEEWNVIIPTDYIIIFHSVGNFILPTDSYFSEGLKPPTRWCVHGIS
jgi:hypothetical protein